MVVRTCLLLVLAVLGGCEVTDSQRATAACEAICECQAAPLPALQDRCVAQCTAQVDVQLSDDCLACVSSHDTCATLERDCEPLCNPSQPVPDPGFPDGGVR